MKTASMTHAVCLFASASAFAPTQLTPPTPPSRLCNIPSTPQLKLKASSSSSPVRYFQLGRTLRRRKIVRRVGKVASAALATSIISSSAYAAKTAYDINKNAGITAFAAELTIVGTRACTAGACLAIISGRRKSTSTHKRALHHQFAKYRTNRHLVSRRMRMRLLVLKNLCRRLQLSMRASITKFIEDSKIHLSNRDKKELAHPLDKTVDATCFHDTKEEPMDDASERLTQIKQKINTIASSVGASTLATLFAKIGSKIDRLASVSMPAMTTTALGAPSLAAKIQAALARFVPTCSTIGTAIGASLGAMVGIKVANFVLTRMEMTVRRDEQARQ